MLVIFFEKFFRKPEYLNYILTFVDIRELIEIDDAMDDKALRFGPNGGLIFCME